MNRITMALAVGIVCAPTLAIAQDDDAPAQSDTTPAPSADCATLDCNSTRQQQDNLNNNSGTPGAQDSLGDDQGTTGGSGTLAPTTPNDSLSGDDNRGGLSGSGGLDGGSSSGGLGD